MKYYRRRLQRPCASRDMPDNIMLYESKITVRWGDMDALGHVNNIIYSQYFEQSRIEWYESLGLKLSQTDEGMILLKSSITFRKPVVYPATVRIEVRAGSLGRTSFSLLSTLFVVGQDAEPFADNESVLVWFDYRTQQPIPVPDHMRKVLSGAER